MTHTPFDYPIRPYNMSLANYFVRAPELQTHSGGIIDGFNSVQKTELECLVHQLRLSDGAPGTSAFALAAPSSLDRMSLMKLYFPNEVDEHETFAEIGDMVDEVVPHDGYIDEMLVMSMSQINRIVQPEFASPFDLFGVSTIEVVEEIQLLLLWSFQRMI